MTFKVPGRNSGNPVAQDNSAPHVFPVQEIEDAGQLRGRTRREDPCRSCFGRGNCQVANLLEMVSFQSLARSLQTRSIAAGEAVFQTGDPHECLYVVKSGSVRSSLVTLAGEDQVLSFHLPGEILGLDSTGANQHGSTAMALENSVVCILPLARLEDFIAHSPVAFRWFLDLAGSVLSGYHELFTMLSRMKAEARLCQFLLDLSRRYEARGYSAREFHLTMSRQDISNHLGLALETVSRLFARFQRDGMIQVDRRRVTILDPAALQAMVGSAAASGAGEERGRLRTVVTA